MKYLFCFLLVVVFLSCYEDKGNYDYHEINEVNVHLEEVYVATSLNMTLKIEPEISQTLRENNDNLEFIWQEVEGNEVTDTIGTNAVLELVINSTDPGFKYDRYLRLVVIDEEAGLQYITPTQLHVSKPFFKSWMILHEKEGVTQLAAVEYIGGETRFRENVFKEESGENLQGKPIKLGVFEHFYGSYFPVTGYYSYTFDVLGIFTDNLQESGIYDTSNKFNLKASMDRLIYPNDRVNFDIENVSFLGSSSSGTGICITNGQLFQSVYDGKFYKANISSDLKGDIYLTHAGKEANHPILYDGAGHRFCFYYNDVWQSDCQPFPVFDPIYENSLEWELKPIPKRAGNVSTVDPNALTIPQKMLYIGRGYGSDRYDQCVYAIALGENKCYIYEFNNGSSLVRDDGEATFKAYHEVEIPKDLTTTSQITSSRLYNGVFFYTAGNAVYRYDFNTETSREVYRHEGAIKAVYMDFAKREDSWMSDDIYVGDNWSMLQQIGIAFDMGNGTSEFVVLHLDTSGKVNTSNDTSYPDIQVYKGLGNVADVAYI